MHPNPIYRTTPDARNLAFARERGFGMLTICDETGPLLAHVPFVLDEAGAMAELHLLRSNPIARAATGPVQAVIAITGPDSYISPDWYGIADQVPTWNYIAVHLRGTLVPLPHDDLRGALDRLSAHFETTLAPKTPWTSDTMSPGVMERMMRAITPFRFDVAEVQGTWKLNQNKPDPAREGAASNVEAYGIGQETALLSAFMRAASDPPGSSD